MATKQSVKDNVCNFDLYEVTVISDLTVGDQLIVQHPRTYHFCVVRLVKIRKEGILVELLHNSPAGVFWKIKLPILRRSVYKIYY